MALITNITSREYAGNQPFRDWNCKHYKKCLDQAAKVNGLLDCDGCNTSEKREHLDLYDIELEARLLFAVFYPYAWRNHRQGRIGNVIFDRRSPPTTVE